MSFRAGYLVAPFLIVRELLLNVESRSRVYTQLWFGEHETSCLGSAKVVALFVGFCVCVLWVLDIRATYTRISQSEKTRSKVL